MVCTTAGKNGLGNIGPGSAFAGQAIPVRTLAATILIGQHLARPPRESEAVAEDSAVMAAVTVEVAGALPGHDGREMGRPQGSNLPLFDGQIRDTDQPHLAVGPGLDTGPFDPFVEVSRFD